MKYLVFRKYLTNDDPFLEITGAVEVFATTATVEELEVRGADDLRRDSTVPSGWKVLVALVDYGCRQGLVYGCQCTAEYDFLPPKATTSRDRRAKC